MGDIVSRTYPVVGDAEYLRAMRADLLRFGARAVHPLGFGWLDDVGGIGRSDPLRLWITCRMTHVFSLGVLARDTPAVGGPDAAALQKLAAHGVTALSSAFEDDRFGGWYSEVSPSGPVVTTKTAYGHAFVLLAAASATVAGVPGSADLLERAVAVWTQRFWDDEAGMVVDEWDQTWTRLDAYRGANANMHTVEACLAAADATGDGTLARHAVRICTRIEGVARAHGWRLPEHFDSTWTPLLHWGLDDQANPFRPYGATVGHAMEWARLFIAVREAVDEHDLSGLLGDVDLHGAAVRLADRAVADGWARDGHDGFIYTTDWAGSPVVRNRMHWVVAEALNAGWVLDQALGQARYAELVQRWWRYVDRYLVDGVNGSWHHELSPDNTPTSTTWHGKPDVYHAYQAALMPTFGAAPSVAGALARVGRAR